LKKIYKSYKNPHFILEYGSSWQFSSQVKFLSPLIFDLSVPSEVKAEIIIEWQTNAYF
jgi:hypothetical protein